MITEEMAAELATRRQAAPEVQWGGVDEWVDRMYALIRPGGKLALVLPDGRPFTATKPRPSITCPDCGWTSHHPTDVAEGYCGNCHAWTMTATPKGEQR